jgi:GTPase Era involved in 16S rRNA processing
MKIDSDKFSLPFVLEKHPLFMERADFIMKYLNGLEYFIRRYVESDLIALKMFENYKHVFLQSGDIYKRIGENKIACAIKNILGLKFKGFKFLSFRHVFIFDLVILAGQNKESSAFSVVRDLKPYLSKKEQVKVSNMVNCLFQRHSTEEKYYLTDYHFKSWQSICLFNDMPKRTIMISSNMSSGKSALVNALAGKKINRSMHDACTSKLHVVYDKPFEDNFIYKADKELTFNANLQTLMEYDVDNNDDSIYVSSYFRFIGSKKFRLCVIDSPGVNNSMDNKQEEIKNLIFTQNFDLFLYVINAEYLGTNDDYTYLQFLKNNIGNRRIIFVLNKLDKFRLAEDNIEETIEELKKRLKNFGFENPCVCPVSAYSGLLAKSKLYNYDLSDEDNDEYELLTHKFTNKEYDLSKYYSEKLRKTVNENIKKEQEKHQDALALLNNSGILCLETILHGEEI